jgi:hypothetical protein
MTSAILNKFSMFYRARTSEERSYFFDDLEGIFRVSFLEDNTFVVKEAKIPEEIYEVLNNRVLLQHNKVHFFGMEDIITYFIEDETFDVVERYSSPPQDTFSVIDIGDFFYLDYGIGTTGLQRMGETIETEITEDLNHSELKGPNIIVSGGETMYVNDDRSLTEVDYTLLYSATFNGVSYRVFLDEDDIVFEVNGVKGYRISKLHETWLTLPPWKTWNVCLGGGFFYVLSHGQFLVIKEDITTRTLSRQVYARADDKFLYLTTSYGSKDRVTAIAHADNDKILPLPFYKNVSRKTSLEIAIEDVALSDAGTILFAYSSDYSEIRPLDLEDIPLPIFVIGERSHDVENQGYSVTDEIIAVKGNLNNVLQGFEGPYVILDAKSLMFR